MQKTDLCLPVLPDIVHYWCCYDKKSNRNVVTIIFLIMSLLTVYIDLLILILDLYHVVEAMVIDLLILISDLYHVVEVMVI